MPVTATCPQCGQPLAADAPSGLCPRCLLQAGLPESSAGGSASGFAPTTPRSAAFAAPTAEELAAEFPQLEILSLIGRGGMGAVYRARQRTLDRLVAVKILPPEVGADPAFAERFTREAQALARLNHHNILSVYDFGRTEGGLYYFVMEYVDGVNLRQLLTQPLEPQRALAIVPQICEALQYAHVQGVVHRDIKPENILIDQTGRVKIADFGLAKLLGQESGRESLTGTRQVMGTPHYMAPEQMSASRTVDHRADIYSLGVVFYELLTGELPIGRFDPPSRRAAIDRRLDPVVLRALESEPARRYQGAGEVKTDLDLLSRTPPRAPLSSDDTPPTAEQRWSGLGHDAADSPSRRELQDSLQFPTLSLILIGGLTLVGHAIATIVSLQNPYDAQMAWVGLPGVFTGLLMAVGGLSLRWWWSSTWAHLGAIAALLPVGPGWLFSAFLGVWIWNILSRPEVRSAFHERLERERFSRQPRFSRKAIVAACWAPWFFLATVLLATPVSTTVQRRPSLTTQQTTITAGEASSGAAPLPLAPSEVATLNASRAAEAGMGRPAWIWWQWFALLVIAPLGLTAPLGTTILGMMAMHDIRHSQGRVIGLPLAVASAVGYPLLVLDGVITAFIALTWYFVMRMFGGSPGAQGLSVLTLLAPTLLLALPVCGVVDLLLARAVYLNARQPAGK